MHFEGTVELSGHSDVVIRDCDSCALVGCLLRSTDELLTLSQ